VVPGVCGFCVREAAARPAGAARAPGGAAALAFSEALVRRYAFHAFESNQGEVRGGPQAGKCLAWSTRRQRFATHRIHSAIHTTVLRSGPRSDRPRLACQVKEFPLRHATAGLELWTARLLAAVATSDISEYKRLRLQRAPGDDARAADYDQRTALHLAAAEGRHRLVKLLLTAGADPEARDRWGRTPLDEAEPGSTIQAELQRHMEPFTLDAVLEDARNVCRPAD
jgi:hypothetical protein